MNLHINRPGEGWFAGGLVFAIFAAVSAGFVGSAIVHHREDVAWIFGFLGTLFFYIALSMMMISIDESRNQSEDS